MRRQLKWTEIVDTTEKYDAVSLHLYMCVFIIYISHNLVYQLPVLNKINY